jgi:hypothetical protein
MESFSQSNQTQFLLVGVLLVASSFMAYFIVMNKSQFPCYCQECQSQNVEDEVARQIYGSGGFQKKYGGNNPIVGQLYSIFIVSLVIALVYFVYQSNLSQRVSGLGTQYGQEFGVIGTQ